MKKKSAGGMSVPMRDASNIRNRGVIPFLKSERVRETDASGEISLKAKEALNMMNAVQKAPDVRVEKIMEIRAKILAGTYKVAGEKVAECLIKERLLETIL